MHAHDAGLPDPIGAPHAAHRNAMPIAGRIDPSYTSATDAAPPPALSAAPDLGSLLRALRRRWMVVVALGVPLALLAGFAAWTLMAPRYTAFAQFRVSYDQPHIVFPDKSGSYNLFSTYLRTHAAQVKSRPVIAAALKREEVRRLNLEARYPDPAQWLDEAIRVEFAEPSEILTLLLNGPDPTEAVTLVKAITASYMDEIVYAEQRGRVSRVAELEKVYNETLESNKTRKNNLRRLAESLGTTSEAVLTQQQLEMLASLRDAKAQRNQARGEVLKAEAALASHLARAQKPPELTITDAMLDEALRGDPDTAALLAQATRCREVIKDYEQNAVNPREATRVRAERMLRDAQKQIEKRRGEARTLLAKRMGEQHVREHELVKNELETTLQGLNTYLAKMQAEVDELTAKSSKIGVSSSELESLRAEIKREEKVLDDVGDRLEKLRLELRSPQRVSVYQEGELQKADSKRRLMAASVSPFGVLGLIGLGVALLEHRRRRIRTASDVAGGLGIRVVGAVPNAPAPDQILGPAGDPAFEGHPALESIDAIRTILLRETGSDGRVVLVTSATEGEGKTTLAAHLAGSLARAGRKTLLIDGDLRRPAVNQLFELPLQPGFSEVLLGEIEAADAVQETAIDGLAVMTAGQWDREVLQALARDGLEGVFEKLREEFDFLVIDSHPILPAADTLLIAQRADSVILSVMREVSQAPRVYSASQRLSALGVPVLGAVLNAADPEEIVTANAYVAPAAA